MSRRDRIAHLRQTAPHIAPSLLLCDFGNLEREVERLTAAGVGVLHLDVMDGVFVPNLSYGMPIVAALRKLTKLPLDVHLMISRPEDYVEAFYDAGADGITIHVEATSDCRALLERIRLAGAAAGVALNPGTPLSAIEHSLPLCDSVLIMTVEAGFGGQKFNPEPLAKLKQLRDMRNQKAISVDTLLVVDGGVNATTIGQCAGAGADVFVVGSAIFRADSYTQAVADLTAAAARNPRPPDA